MLSLKGLSTSPPRQRISDATSTKISDTSSSSYISSRMSSLISDSSSSCNSSKKSSLSRLSPTRLVPKGMVPKGMKALVTHNHDKRRRSVRPLIHDSVASSITYSEFEPSQDLSALLDGDLVPPPTTMKRAVSMDSDSKPLRPYRRGSSACHVEHHKSDYAEPSGYKDVLSCSVNSSITFADFQDMSGLLGLGEDCLAEEVPPPPSMTRAMSMDSDSKPLRPLRRESQYPSIIPETHEYYPEPTRTTLKRSGSLDSQPMFPYRRDSASVRSKGSSNSSSSNQSLLMDCSPGIPGRKSSVISLGYEVAEANKRTSSDDQPCMPSRKTSLAHNSLTSKETPEELVSSMEDQDEARPPDTEMMTVTSAVA